MTVTITWTYSSVGDDDDTIQIERYFAEIQEQKL